MVAGRELDRFQVQTSEDIGGGRAHDLRAVAHSAERLRAPAPGENGTGLIGRENLALLCRERSLGVVAGQPPNRLHLAAPRRGRGSRWRARRRRRDPRDSLPRTRYRCGVVAGWTRAGRDDERRRQQRRAGVRNGWRLTPGAKRERLATPRTEPCDRFLAGLRTDRTVVFQRSWYGTRYLEATPGSARLRNVRRLRPAAYAGPPTARDSSST